MGFLNWLSRAVYKTPPMPSSVHDPQPTIDAVNAREEKVTSYVRLNMTQFAQLCESRGIKLEVIGPPKDFSNIAECKEWTRKFTLKMRFSGSVKGELPQFTNQGVRMALRTKKEYNLK